MRDSSRSSISGADSKTSPPEDGLTSTPDDNRSTPLNLDLEKARSRGSLATSNVGARSTLSRIRSRAADPPRFSHPLSHTKTGTDVVVDFDGPGDLYRPMNWPRRKKVITTLLYGFTTMGATWASSVYSSGVRQIAGDFHVSLEVSTLGLSLYLFGFGLGPLLWAPISEVYGRKASVLAPYFISACFSFGTATAKDIQTVIITRFFAGLFGSAPVTNTGGVLGDLWSPRERGAAIVGYAMTIVGGAIIAPIAGGAIVQSYLRWRWTEYLTGIIMLSSLAVDILLLDESYPPMLLVYKARRLRHETGNWALHAKHEEWDVSFKELREKYLVRPFQMLGTPICFLVALYASFVYGIIYLAFSAFPIEFEEERGWNQVVGPLPFLSLLIGILFGACLNLYNQGFYVKRYEANHNRAVPEARLPPMMVGSFFFAAGLFIFAWTSNKDIHWIGPVIGVAVIGFGFFTIFQSALNYLIDTFQRYSASAVAANTFLRSVFAGAFPLFSTPMFHKLGINWASSLIGFVAVAMIPIPFLFYIYGKRIRARGKWSAESVT